MFHDGQLEGREIHLPIQLLREPGEIPDPEVMQFYRRLLMTCNASAYHDGEWALMEADRAWEGNESHHNFLVWTWRYADQFKIVVVNYSLYVSQGRLKLPIRSHNSGSLLFRDELTGMVYIRDPDEIRRQGLYVELGPWQAHLFDMAPETMPK